MRISFTETAVDDLEQAQDRYASIEPGLADDFLDSLDRLISRLEMFPHGAPPVEGFPAMRRARMRQFPYGVFYQFSVVGDITIIRVLHSRRDHSSSVGE